MKRIGTGRSRNCAEWLPEQAFSLPLTDDSICFERASGNPGGNLRAVFGHRAGLKWLCLRVSWEGLTCVRESAALFAPAVQDSLRCLRVPRTPE